MLELLNLNMDQFETHIFLHLQELFCLPRYLNFLHLYAFLDIHVQVNVNTLSGYTCKH